MSWSRGRQSQSSRERVQRRRVLHEWPVCYLGYPGCTGVSTEDDHVIPVAVLRLTGTPDTYENHRGVCHACHKIKSQREAQDGRRRNSRWRDPEPHPNRRKIPQSE